MSEVLHTYVEALRSKNAVWVLEVIEAHGELSVVVPREAIVDACGFLRRSTGLICLPTSAVADRGPEEEPRFVVNYHLFSTKHHNRIRLKVRLSEDDPHVESVSRVWKNGELARAGNIRPVRANL
jgi:NADH-quinone oxidoreductase subunit C